MHQRRNAWAITTAEVASWAVQAIFQAHFNLFELEIKIAINLTLGHE